LIGVPYSYSDGRGSEGVSEFVSATDGAIGYIEYAYAKRDNLASALVQNLDGEFVVPSNQSFKSTVANANWSDTSAPNMPLINLPGKESWPISGATYVLMSRNQPSREVASMMLRFFDWAYGDGAALADNLDYVPIPGRIVRSVETTWSEIRARDGWIDWSPN
jgi:phosphate transport system substrate-binding protein